MLKFYRPHEAAFMKQSLKDFQKAMYAADINFVLLSNDVGMPERELQKTFIEIGSEYIKYVMQSESQEEFLNHAYAIFQYGILWSVNDKRKYDVAYSEWKKGRGEKPSLIKIEFPDINSIKAELFKTSLLSTGKRMSELIASGTSNYYL